MIEIQIDIVTKWKIKKLKMKNKEEIYEEIMALAYNLEDMLSYDETPGGLRWGKLVNKLQEFEFDEIEEKNIPILFYTIKHKIGWGKWCDVTGGNHYALNECYSPKDNEIFYCTESQAKQLNLN